MLFQASASAGVMLRHGAVDLVIDWSAVGMKWFANCADVGGCVRSFFPEIVSVDAEKAKKPCVHVFVCTCLCARARARPLPLDGAVLIKILPADLSLLLTLTLTCLTF